jgi:hypothetical protein
VFLAEGVQSLVQHMREEQSQIRKWMDEQAAGQRELRRVLEKMTAQSAPGGIANPVVIVDVEPTPPGRAGS